MTEKTYTVEQIMAAFWKEFHESGELWFPYSATDRARNARVTEGAWGDFLQSLERQES